MGFKQTQAGTIRYLYSPTVHHVMDTGDDLRGLPYSISRPFKTIQKVIDDHYEDGDLILVWSGDHEITSTITSGGVGISLVEIEFMAGARLHGNIAGQLLIATDETIIYGAGQFENTNEALGGASIACFSGAMRIKGAKSIIAQSGTCFSSNTWLSIENVDELKTYAKGGAAYALQAGNSANFDGVNAGIIRNIRKLGNDDGVNTALGLRIQVSADKTVVVENCNLFGTDQYALNCDSNTDGHAVVKDCTIKTVGAGGVRALGIGAFDIKFINCHVQNSGGLETVWITDQGLDNDPKPIFENCSFRNNGNGVCIQARGPAQFYGVNRFWSINAPTTLSGLLHSENRLAGMLLSNLPPQDGGNQIWQFNINEAAPTPGETYTITAPDATTIEYTVLGGDTDEDVAIALAAAWDAEAALGNNIWEKFNTNDAFAPLGYFIATASDEIYNLDPDDGFVLSTDGADDVSTAAPTIAAFVTVGPGKIIIDENLVVPEI